MRSIRKRANALGFMCSLIVGLTACIGCRTEKQDVDTDTDIIPLKKEMVVQVDTGTVKTPEGGDLMTYSLSILTSSLHYGSEDLLLVLRNTSAKGIDLHDLTVSNFTLCDSRGEKAKLVLRSQPKSVQWGEASSVQIGVLGFTGAHRPLVLTLNKPSTNSNPVYLCVSNIYRR
jgi:hypothetical protein